jgi:chitodextrinase
MVSFLRRQRTTQQPPSEARRRLLLVIAACLVGGLVVGGSSDALGAQSADTKPPTTPGKVWVSAATQSSLTLSWWPSHDDVALAKQYEAAFDAELPAPALGAVLTPQLVTYIRTGLACGRTYAVRVIAVDDAGNRAEPAKLAAATAPCVDSNAPSAPGQVAQVASSPSSATISWGKSSDDFGVVGYELWRNGVLAGTTWETSFTLGGLSCGSSASGSLRAYDAAGNKSNPTSFVVTTSKCSDIDPPSAPGTPRQTARTGTSVSATWAASADNVGVAAYTVFLGGTRQGVTNERTITVTGLACGKQYSLAVEANDAAGNKSSRSAADVRTAACTGPSTPTGDKTPPSVPSSLSVSAATATGIGLAWHAASDNVGVDHYNVLRANNVIGTTTETKYSVAGLACGTSYGLGVVAYDAAGNASSPAQVLASTAPCADSQAPTKPSGVFQQTKTATSISIAWSPSSDNAGVVGYAAYRNGAVVGTTSQPGYTFSGLACGMSYTLGVDAYDAAGNRSAVTAVMMTTGECSDGKAPTTPTGLKVSGITSTGVTLAWTGSTDNVAVDGYEVTANNTTVATTKSTSATLAGLTCGRQYTLGVSAFDTSGNRSPVATVVSATATCSDAQPPTVPTGLKVSGVTSTSATLAWTGSTDNVAVDGYNVYAGVANVATTKSTTATLAGLACGRQYTLGVSAFDTSDNESSTATTTVTTSSCTSSQPSTGALFVSPSGSDSGSCTTTAPCSSFDKAYRTAQPGQVVSVAAGSYPAQTIRYMSGRDSAAQVTFAPAGTVAINGNLEIHASGVHLQGQATGSIASWRSRSYSFRVTGYTSVEGDSSTQYPRNVTIEGIDTGNLGTYSSDNVIVRDTNVGPRLIEPPCQWPENRIAANGVSGRPPTNVLWERVVIHNQNRSLAAANNDCHYGGLQLWNGSNITIRQSVFERNVVYHIDVGESGYGPSNVVLSGNSFSCPADNSWVGDRCAGQRAVQFGAPANYVRTFTLSGNISANGSGGLYGCYSEPCGFTGLTAQGNVDVGESPTAPAPPG